MDGAEGVVGPFDDAEGVVRFGRLQRAEAVDQTRMVVIGFWRPSSTARTSPRRVRLSPTAKAKGAVVTVLLLMEPPPCWDRLPRRAR